MGMCTCVVCLPVCKNERGVRGFEWQPTAEAEQKQQLILSKSIDSPSYSTRTHFPCRLLLNNIITSDQHSEGCAAARGRAECVDRLLLQKGQYVIDRKWLTTQLLNFFFFLEVSRKGSNHERTMATSCTQLGCKQQQHFLCYDPNSSRID